MARGTYGVRFENVSHTAANGDHDFFAITPGSNLPVQIMGIQIGQTTHEGDVNEDLVRWGIVAMTGATFTAGTGGSAPTPFPTSFPGEDAAEFTARVNDTAIATSTGTVTHGPVSTFNIRAGLDLPFLPPEYRITLYPGTGNNLIVRQYSTMDADTSFSGTLWVKEGL